MLKLLYMQERKGYSGRIKICYFITKGVWGGAGRYVYDLATMIPKDRYDIFVITGEGKVLKEKLEKEGTRVYTIKNLKRDVSIKSEIKSFFQVLKILWKEKPDILHLNSPKAGGLGVVAGRLLFIKHIILTVHGFTWNEDRGLWNKTLITFFTWITIFLSNKTIVIAPQEQKQVMDLPFIRDRKIVLIRNGVENIVFMEKELARESLTSTVGKVGLPKFWIGTISELHKNKGLEYIINALTKVNRDFVFLIIGTGEEEEKLQHLVRKNNLENKVFFVGFLDDANKYLKAFDIFTLTSMKEGLPYTLLEAGLASLPILASSVGGVPDIIDNGVNGILVTRGKQGEITRAIEYMMDNKEKSLEFGVKLKEKVESQFRVEEMVKKTLAVYGE